MVDLDTVVLLGTGDFARAFCSRYLRTNTDGRVIIGSRDPSREYSGRFKTALNQAIVMNVKDSIQSGDIIVLCVPPGSYPSLAQYSDQLIGKILVEVSNGSASSHSSSAAQELAGIFPKSRVVKAFNTISAEDICSESARSDAVYVCSNDVAARDTISRLATKMGFIPIQFGGLDRAKELEARASRVFAGWGWPSVVLLIISVFWIIFTLCRHFKLRKDPYSWDRLPTNVFNKIAGSITLTLLSLVYMPGCVAAFYQLAKRTKHCDFPSVLNTWLTMRRKLGLFALLFVWIHLMLSLSLMSPPYFPKWYIKKYTTIEITPNETAIFTIPVSSRMNWIGEICIMFGVLGLLSLTLLGVSTLPSVATMFNWREWRWIHTHLGFLCLLLSACHVTIKGASGWTGKDARDIIPTVTFLSSVLPWVTLLMRIVLYLPWVSNQLDEIRQGAKLKTVGDQKSKQEQHWPKLNSSVRNNDGELSIIV